MRLITESRTKHNKSHLWMAFFMALSLGFLVYFYSELNTHGYVHLDQILEICILLADSKKDRSERFEVED